MNAFIVELKDQPGELARVTEAIAAKGIDIKAFAGATCGGSGAIVLITNDEGGTRAALASVGGGTVREAELVTIGLENRPGSLAEIARKLADGGINVEAAMPTGMSGNTVHVAFATSDPARTREILGDRVMTATMG